MLDSQKIANTEADTAQEIGLRLDLLIAHSGALRNILDLLKDPRCANGSKCFRILIHAMKF